MLLGYEEVIINQDEVFKAKGTIPHSVWSNQDEKTVMIGISVRCFVGLTSAGEVTCRV